jgi:hypothetical protein
MARLILILTGLLLASFAPAGAASAPQGQRDLYFGEALYDAYQQEWFEAIARLDTELEQHHGLDEPELDSLYQQVDLAEFDVGDFELAYRMHRRAGRAITAVIEGKVAEPVRNEALFRLARIYFQKDQPVNALHALDRIAGEIPPAIRDDLEFLRAQVLMANGRFSEAVPLLRELLKFRQCLVSIFTQDNRPNQLGRLEGNQTNGETITGSNFKKIRLHLRLRPVSKIIRPLGAEPSS